jgi:hypothetical protein
MIVWVSGTAVCLAALGLDATTKAHMDRQRQHQTAHQHPYRSLHAPFISPLTRISHSVIASEAKQSPKPLETSYF